MSIKSSPLDWLSFPPTSPGDVHAPHPDLFDLELDSSITALPQDDQEQLQLLNIELSDPYAFLRSDTPRCGPPSTFTVSSESTYDSSRSESFYNFVHSPTGLDAGSDYAVDLGIDFANFSVDVDATAAADADAQLRNIKDEPDHPSGDNESSFSPSHAFGMAPTSVYSEAPAPAASAIHAAQSPQDFYTAIFDKPLAAAQATISPDSLLPRSSAPSNMELMPTSVSPSSTNGRHSVSSSGVSEAPEQSDPRKKYKCPSCPRAFARAYNLKTHLQTHDPNRLKPHTCPHRSCGRSFSRKHDLGRHLVSIHRAEAAASSGDVEHKNIGVARGARGWCDRCGNSSLGKQPACTCQDVK